MLGQPREAEEAPAEDAHGEPAAIVRRRCRRPEEHDDEQKQDHDGAGVDDELDRGEKLRVEREKEAGHTQDEEQEPHRAADRVLGEDDGRRAADREQGAHVEVGYPERAHVSSRAPR